MLLTALLKNHCFCLNFTIIFSANLYLKPGNLLVKFSMLRYKIFTLSVCKFYIQKPILALNFNKNNVSVC